ncbi:MAG: OprO/OprP family phosphate-selective porin [Burkholderiales bacterium]|nr:OprO/OprP family phosphate-selective porin [Burkholderiales bacterium]
MKARPPQAARAHVCALVRLAAVVAVTVLCVDARPALADVIELATGERLVGKVLKDDGAGVEFESDALGKLVVPRERVTRIERTVEKKAVAQAPAAAVSAPPADSGPTAPPPEADRTASELPDDGTRAAAVPPPPEKREDLLRVWIDQGLRYQIVQPVRVPLPFTDAELLREEVRVTGRIGLRLSLDAAGFSGGAPDFPTGGTALRALRLYTTGDWSPTTSYAVQIGFIDGRADLFQAVVRWRNVPYVGNVNFGYQVVSQTLENVLPFGGGTFMEGALPVQAFAPGNRMGVTTDQSFRNGQVVAQLGLYSAGTNPGLNFGDQTQSLLRPTVRLVTAPVLIDPGTAKGRVLHLGLGSSLTIAEGSEVRYRARPESFIAPFVVDTGLIASRRALASNVELLALAGPLMLQGEAMYTRVDAATGPYQFLGAYLQTAWTITGEQPAYNRAVGIPERIIPSKEFSWSEGTWGAWQVALRGSTLDLADGSAKGGRITEGTLGLNWWWNRYLRWQLNYNYAHIADNAFAGHLHVLQGRVQLMY